MSAQTSGTWTANANGDWSTTSNWAGGTVADGAGAFADFGTVDLTAGRTITLDSNRTIGQLIFGDAIWTNSGFDWTLQSGTLTLDNTGGTGGNPASITVLNRTTTISSILAGSDGLSLALPWSNYDTTRGTANSSGNGGVSQTSGGLTFTGSNTLSGTLSVTGGNVRVGGAAGRFGSVTALSVGGNGSFLNGDATAASNNGITNRVGDGTATLSLGGASGAGTFTSAFAASDNTTSQTFASLTINAGQNVLNTVNTAAGTNNLIFTGAGGTGYVRNTNGLLNVVPATGFNPQFTNAPTAAGGSSVSGSAGSGDEILIGAVLNGNDFIAAASGNLAAATYDTTLTAGKNVNVTGALATSGNLSINSLRFGENAARTLTIGASDTLTLASGGILTGSAVATSGNTITGGSITSSQGDLWIYANGSGLSNPRVGGNALTIASKITGAMSVTVGGGQQVVFGNSANDYTGGTFFTGGILAVGSDGALGAASGTVTAVGGRNYLTPSASFTFNADRNFVVNSGAALFIAGRPVTTTIAGQLSGGGQFGPGFVSDGQQVILTGNNSGFTGQYMVNGRLQATEGTSLSSNANLLFTGRANFGAGVLETSGTFTRSLGSGAGQVQWQNDGQYGSGGFAAVGGALTVNIGGNATPDTLTWGSGYFLPNGGQELVLRDVTFQNQIALNGGLRRIVASGVVTISGQLSGNANSGINKLTTGTLVLTGSNTYAGKTLISAGTVSASSLNSVSGGNASSSLGAPTTAANGTIDVGSGTAAGTLLYTGTGEITDRVVNLAGTTGGVTLDQSGSGLLKFTSDLTATGSGAKTLTLQGSTAGTGEIAGAIVDYTGDGGPLATAVTKAGTGTWTLSGANTYTGLTTISAGRLTFSGGNDRLPAAGAITIGASGTLDLAGFSQTTTGVVTFAAGSTLAGGSLTSNNAAARGNNWLPAGTVNLGANGSFVTNQRLLIANGGSRAVTLNGPGAMTFGGDAGNFMNYVGVGNATGAGASLTLTGGATANFTNSTSGTGNGYLNVGSNSDSALGSITVNSGALNVGTFLKLGGNFNNNAGTNATASLAITSGTVTVGGGSNAGSNGLLFMNGSSGDATTTGNTSISINSGGVLAVTAIRPGFGTKTITFDGGTLRARQTETNFLNATAGLTVNVGNGGAIIDTVSSNITISAALTAAGIGGLTKSGFGTLTLSGANTFTGLTTVSGGTLAVDGSLASGVAIAGGAFLGGSGSVSGVLSGAGIVSPGNSPGILTAGQFDPTAGLGAAFEFTNFIPTYNAPSASVNDVLRLTNVSPFTSSLTTANAIDVYFNVNSITSGDIFEGGFFTSLSAGDLLTNVQNATFRYWVQDNGGATVFGGVNYASLTSLPGVTGVTLNTVSRTTDFGSGEVTGSVTQFVIVPEPGAIALAGIGIGLAGWIAYRRRT